MLEAFKLASKWGKYIFPNSQPLGKDLNEVNFYLKFKGMKKTTMHAVVDIIQKSISVSCRNLIIACVLPKKRNNFFFFLSSRCSNIFLYTRSQLINHYKEAKQSRMNENNNFMLKNVHFGGLTHPKREWGGWEWLIKFNLKEKRKIK